MTASLQDDLAYLTGEEVYHLVNELIRCEVSALDAMARPASGKTPAGDLSALWLEFVELRCIATAQIARITIPLREAAALVYRARYSRHHPVRVPGTEHG
jgi:hypothetical protein